MQLPFEVFAWFWVDHFIPDFACDSKGDSPVARQQLDPFAGVEPKGTTSTRIRGFGSRSTPVAAGGPDGLTKRGEWSKWVNTPSTGGKCLNRKKAEGGTRVF